jgi:hypothetical protein
MRENRELLWNYDCDWNATNLFERILAINNARGLLPDAALRKAFTQARDGRTRS